MLGQLLIFDAVPRGRRCLLPALSLSLTVRCDLICGAAGLHPFCDRFPRLTSVFCSAFSSDTSICCRGRIFSPDTPICCRCLIFSLNAVRDCSSCFFPDAECGLPNPRRDIIILSVRICQDTEGLRHIADPLHIKHAPDPRLHLIR